MGAAGAVKCTPTEFQITLGGATGDECERRLVALGIQVEAIHTRSATRVNLEIIDANGETIILDSGTTTQEIAKRIKDKQNLTVITNGVNIAMELVGVRGIQVVLLGGVLGDNAFSIGGHFAEEMLQHLSADKLFLAADACDLDFGISTPNLEESRVNQAMVRIAREKILVADSSKFGKRGLSRIVPLFEMNQVITDGKLAPEFQRALRDGAVELTLV